MAATATKKPKKPYPTFPLFAHAKGYWAKKIDGKQVSFGPWDPDNYEATWKAALKRFENHAEAVAHGRHIEEHPDQVTVGLLVNAYLTHQHERLEREEITAVHFHDVKTTLTRFRDSIGREMQVGELERTGVPVLKAYLDRLRADYGWYAYNRHVAIVKATFKWAEHPVDGILGQPFRLAPLLVKQGEKVRRRESNEKVELRGHLCFTLPELRAMLYAGGTHHYAMALLGYFCGYGNSDCARLTTDHVDLDPDPSMGLPAGWGHIHFPRPKTGIERAAVIPPLVCDAIRASLAERPKHARPKWAKLVFVTKDGFPYARKKVHRDDKGVVQKVVSIDSVGLMHGRARDRLGVCSKHGPMLSRHLKGGRCPECGEALKPMRPLGFYTYRHTALTYGGGTTTPDAIQLWEGHAIQGIRGRYVAFVEVPKLKPIADALLERLTRTQSPSAASDAATAQPAQASGDAASAASAEPSSPRRRKTRAPRASS